MLIAHPQSVDFPNHQVSFSQLALTRRRHRRRGAFSDSSFSDLRSAYIPSRDNTSPKARDIVFHFHASDLLRLYCRAMETRRADIDVISRIREKKPRGETLTGATRFCRRNWLATPRRDRENKDADMRYIALN